MSTWAYWIQSKKMILDLSISTNPSNCSYTFATNLHYSVNYNLFCLFICQIIISNLYNVYLNLHSHTCGSLHSVFLPDTHHHREFFLETEQTTPITLTPQSPAWSWGFPSSLPQERHSHCLLGIRDPRWKSHQAESPGCPFFTCIT